MSSSPSPKQCEYFLACHEHAFRAFNGLPEKLLVDNLKSAVLRRFRSRGVRPGRLGRLRKHRGRHRWRPLSFFVMALAFSRQMCLPQTFEWRRNKRNAASARLGAEAVETRQRRRPSPSTNGAYRRGIGKRGKLIEHGASARELVALRSADLAAATRRRPALSGACVAAMATRSMVPATCAGGRGTAAAH
jgi:hypothetical protein